MLRDVAGVGRLYLGALSPTRRAPQVRLDVAGVCTLHLGGALLVFLTWLVWLDRTLGRSRLRAVPQTLTLLY